MNLAVDHSGNLLVLSSAGITGAVYSLRPDGPDGAVTVIEPEPAVRTPRAEIAVPAEWWVNGEFKDQYDPQTDHFTTLAELFAREVAAGPTRPVFVAGWQPGAAGLSGFSSGCAGLSRLALFKCTRHVWIY